MSENVASQSWFYPRVDVGKKIGALDGWKFEPRHAPGTRQIAKQEQKDSFMQLKKGEEKIYA